MFMNRRTANLNVSPIYSGNWFSFETCGIFFLLIFFVEKGTPCLTDPIEDLGFT